MLQIKRFDYVRFGEQLAVVQFRAVAAGECPLPAGAALEVSFGPFAGYRTSSPLRSFELERPPRRGFSRQLIWSASFAVALEVVEYPAARFELTAPGRAALALPPPGARMLVVPGTGGARGARLVASNGRRRIATVATTIAVTTAISPAAGFAAGTVSAKGAPHARGKHSLVKKPKSLGSVRSEVVPHGRVVAAPLKASPADPPPPSTKSWHLAAQPKRPAVAPVHVFSAAPVPASGTTPKHDPATPPAKRHPATPPAKRHPAAPPAKHHPAAPPAKHHPAAPPAKHHPAAPPAAGGGHRVGRPAPRHEHPSGGVPISTPRPLPAPRHEHPEAPPSSPGPSEPRTTPSTLASPSVAAPAPASVPAEALAFSRLSTLFANGNQPPAFLIPIYKAAGRRYHVPWRILAAINSIETNYGRNLNVSSSGAIGWMQFMPATWQQYGVDATRRHRHDRHDQPNPYNPRDAIFSAARYLAANGARHDLRKGIFAYNHAGWYVDEVILAAARITDHSLRPNASARLKLSAMRTMTRLLNGDPYVWGGGHGGWQIVGGYDCSGFVSAVLHAGGYLTMPVSTASLPSQPGIVPGPGKFVTIFDRTNSGSMSSDHVILNLDGEWWESGGTTAAGVHRMPAPSPAYLASFNLMMHPRGL
jgi:Transglycosylase SLT domain